MLRVNLHQFRCWDDLNIEIPIGGITLIKGNSGVGKTTIFQAIAWCLYGNIRLVAPNYMEKAKTHVTIEFPYNLNGINDNLIINRQKNPNRLILSHNNQCYEDKVAQSIIDDIFGSYDIWLSSCYIGQGCRNNFLTAPNTGKMEFLNSIAFHEEDPTFYIERIDDNITEIDSDYKSKLAVFTNNLNSFQSFINSVDLSKALTTEQTNEINQQITTITNEKNKLQVYKSQRDINIGIRNNLLSQLQQANNTVINVISPSPSLLKSNEKYQGGPIDNPDNIQLNIDYLMNIIHMLYKRDDLHSEIIKLDSQLLSFTTLDHTKFYSQEDYLDVLSKETSYRDNQKLAQSLSVSYNEQSIKDSINHHKNILSSQERLILLQDYNNLQNKINMAELNYSQQTTPLNIPDIIPQEIIVPDYSKYNTEKYSEILTELSEKHGSVQSHIQHLQKGHDVLICPHCNGSVRYKQGTLATADTGPSNIDDILSAQKELSFITSEITRIKQLINNLIISENSERANYERSVLLEQRRIDTLKERVQQLKLEQQRRDIDNQNQYNHIQDLKNQLLLLADKLNNLPEFPGYTKILTPLEIDRTHSIIARLNSIIIHDAPSISSQYIQSHINYQNLLEHHSELKSNYNNYITTIPPLFHDESISNIHSHIDSLRHYSNQIKEISTKQNQLTLLKSSLQKQIDDITEKIGTDPSPEIDRLNTQLSHFQELISLSIKAQKGIEYHSQISKERENLVNLNTLLSDLHSLRQHAVETECRILQQVVDSINASIESVCNTLFDSDINITLSLFKTLKTTKNVKPVANFSISYRGGVFDNINQMSGGEGDRASLALTLALNRLSSCPLLMLDESLASLDLNMKEAAINTIRENTNNTVLVIMHDGIEGIYDAIIDCSEFRETQPLS